MSSSFMLNRCHEVHELSNLMLIFLSHILNFTLKSVDSELWGMYVTVTRP